MKSLLTTILFSTIILGITAQSYDVNWGPEYRKQGGVFSTYYVGGFTDDTYHMVMEPRKDPTLLSFNLDHRLLDTEQINFGKTKNPFYFGGFYKTQSGHFGLFSEIDKRSDELRTYVSVFDGEKFGELRAVHIQDYKARGAVMVAGVSAAIDGDSFERMVSSEDKSKVVLVNNTNPRENRRQELLKIAVFDANFERIWETEYRFEEDDDEIQIIGTAVSNQGNVYLLARLSDKSVSGVFGGTTLSRFDEYRLYKITEGDSKITVLPLTGDQIIQYAGIFVDGTGVDEITVAGMYKDEEKSRDLAGVFNISVKEDLTLQNTVSFPFNQQFLDGLISKRANKKERGLEADFFVKSFFKFTDGTVGFIAEESFVRVSRDANGGTTYVYHTNELVIALFNPDRSAVKIQKLEKEYRSSSRRMTSYALGLGDDQLFLVYSTNKNRLERKEILGKGGRGTFTDLTIIDKNGEIAHQQPLFNSNDTEKTFLADQADFNQSHMLLLTARGKYYQCGLLPFHPSN